MAKDTIVLEAEIKSNIGEVNKETKDLTNNFGAFGITIGGIKSKFKEAGKIMLNGLKMIKLQAQLAGVGLKQMFGGKMIRGAKNLFNVIKLGVAATGIGLLIVAFAGLVQYFKDSEAGASKFKEITSQLGVVVGNVSDIISNLGKSFFQLISGDFKGMKESLAEVTQGVKDFGETTKKEMAQAKQLEKDRLALQIFEREAIVQKARTEKDMMELRLKARDFEKFAAEERLAFMREANVLAAEQLEKDLFVAKEKLRFQVEENSYSKSTQQNLDDEAALQAAVFNLEKSNFSERKRLKSEEQAIVKEIQATNKQNAAAAQKTIDDKDKADADALIKKEARAKTEGDILLALQQGNSLALIEDLQERAIAELKIQEDKEIASAELLENAEAVKEAIRIKYARLKGENEVKWSEMSSKEQLGIASSTAGNMAKILGEESAAGKAFAITQATIDTYQGANAAYSSMAKIPYVGPVLGGIAAAAAIASGMANVKAISSAGGGGGGGGGGSTPSVPSGQPAPQMMSGAFDISGGVAPEATKSYVVTDEMTSSQNQLANIRRRATI